jgi:hypothetical protein
MNLIDRKEYNVVEISRNKDFENMKKKEVEIIVKILINPRLKI